MFNSTVYVTEQLNRLMMNAAQELAQRCVSECAQKYGFDEEEAVRHLNIHTIKIERKPTAAKAAKKANTPKEKAVKIAFPLPYNGEFIDACCYALRQNSGLYTQCSGLRKSDAQFCKSCVNQMMKTGAETPEYGTIQQRQAVGIFDYVDPKGRKPIAYTKVMKKNKLTEDQVLTEAGKFNININTQHFVSPVEDSKRGRPKSEKAPKEKGQKGRPKKSKKVVEIEGDDEDLFASLVAEANSDDSSASQSSDEEDETEEKPKSKISNADKEAAKLAEKQAKADKEAAKLAEKAEKEAAKLAEKAEKEAKLAEEKAKKEAEKQAKDAEKAAKLAEKEAEKAAKLAEKEAEKAAKLAEKEQKKSEKKTEKSDDTDAALRVKKITFDNKKYLVSLSTNVVYDYDEYVNNQEQVVVGKWNAAEKTVIFSKSGGDSDEEAEEEYEM